MTKNRSRAWNIVARNPWPCPPVLHHPSTARSNLLVAPWPMLEGAEGGGGLVCSVCSWHTVWELRQWDKIWYVTLPFLIYFLSLARQTETYSCFVFWGLWVLGVSYVVVSTTKTLRQKQQTMLIHPCPPPLPSKSRERTGKTINVADIPA